MEFLKIWEILLRRKWIIIFVFFFFSGTVVLGLSLVTKTYESTTKILVKKSQALNHLKSTLSLPSEDEFDDDYEFKTEITLATVRPLIKEFIAKLEIKDRAGKPIDPDDLIDAGPMNKFRPQPALEVEQYEESKVLKVIATSPDPEQAARMAGTFTRMYMQAEIDRVKDEYKAARGFIEEQIKKVQAAYFDTLAETRAFKIREGSIDLTTEIENLIDKIDDLKNSYDSNERNIASFDSEIEQVRIKLETLSEFKVDSKELTLNDQVKDLQSTVHDNLVNIAATKVELKPDHPEYRELEERLNQAKKLLKAQKTLVLSKESHSVDPIYSALEKKLVDDIIAREIAVAKRDMWQRYIDRYQSELMEMPLKQDTSSKIKSRSSVYKDRYEKLLGYLATVHIAESMTLGNFQLIESAKIPTEPDFPRKLIIIILALFPATFWAFGLGFFVEFIDNTVKDAGDLARGHSLNVLGSVPFFLALQSKKTISGMDWSAPAVESFRTVRNNLRYTFHETQPRTIMVTSSAQDEGKTCVAANLAITLSMEGHQVLLVDLDFKNPTIHDIFDLDNRKGVADIISGQAGPDDVVCSTGIEGLSVVPSGAAVFDSPRWMAPERFRELMDAFKETYDVMVVDTSALTPVNDAINIGTVMDAVILIIGAGKVTVAGLEESVALLDKARVNLAGVLFNKARTYYFMSPVLSAQRIISEVVRRTESYVRRQRKK